MRIGIPRGLLFPKYHVFAETFLTELGEEVILSPETNREILDEGVRRCVDDACLPIKVFHGHVWWLRDRCDRLLLPRMVGVKEREYICPMFSGLNEMVKNALPGLPPTVGGAVYSTEPGALERWAGETGRELGKSGPKVRRALRAALEQQRSAPRGWRDESYPVRVGLIGHAYNVYDAYLNLDAAEKLRELGVGVVTAERVSPEEIGERVARLFKKPFWTFAGEHFGAAAALRETGAVDGLVYLSSFCCGIDSVVVELIREEIGDFPLLVLKLDEHTGEAGQDTRIEAFADMLERRKRLGHYLSQSGECGAGGADALPGA